MINRQLPVNLIGFSMELWEYTRKDIAIWFLLVVICYVCMIVVGGRYDNISKGSDLIRYGSTSRFKKYYVRDMGCLIVLVTILNCALSMLHTKFFSLMMLYGSMFLMVNFFWKASLLFLLTGYMRLSVAVGICFVLETSIFWHKGDCLINIFNWGMLQRIQSYGQLGFPVSCILVIELLLSFMMIHFRKCK